jgi:hypothetical protein
MDSTERSKQYDNDVSAIATERHRKLQVARSQERAAERVAKSFGLRIERRGSAGDPLRHVVYCVFRRSWNFARYCPTTNKLTIGDGLKVIDAATLPDAINLANKYEGSAPKATGRCEQSIPLAPKKKGRKPKKTHHPKKRGHEAKGRKLKTIAPTMYLSADDMALIVNWGVSAAQASEAAEPNALSLDRELVGRLQEALEERVKVIHDPSPMTLFERLQSERKLQNHELN